jgi:hypothetical protein
MYDLVGAPVNIVALVSKAEPEIAIGFQVKVLLF